MNTDFSNAEVLYCILCDYKCNKKQHFKQHCSTLKHRRRLSNDDNYCTTCGKQYKDRTGLWRHSKQCAENATYTNIIQQLISDNKELRAFVVEQANEQKELYVEHTMEIAHKFVEQANEHNKDTIGLINKVMELSRPITITNKSFNINIFLNEKCKNAMNFEEFVERFEISHEDLMNTGRLGFVDGVSKIILDNLKQLSVYQRPIHCTDAKRETIYIKEANQWNRQEDESRMYQAIQEVSRKSTRILLDWKRSNPDYIDGNSDFSIQCISMQRNSMAGYERDTLYPKVVKEVAKGVLIEKDAT
jgi:hypothetical protein